MKIQSLLAAAAMLILFVFCPAAAADEDQYELTKVADISATTKLGKERFDKVKREIIDRGIEVADFKTLLPESVVLEIFSVKTRSGSFDAKELIKGMLKLGYRPAMASEVLSIDKVEGKAAANTPIIALGTIISWKSDAPGGIAVSYPQTEEKGEQMSMHFLVNINSTFNAGRYLIALVKENKD